MSCLFYLVFAKYAPSSSNDRTNVLNLLAGKSQVWPLNEKQISHVFNYSSRQRYSLNICDAVNPDYLGTEELADIASHTSCRRTGADNHIGFLTKNNPQTPGENCKHPCRMLAIALSNDINSAVLFNRRANGIRSCNAKSTISVPALGELEQLVEMASCGRRQTYFQIPLHLTTFPSFFASAAIVFAASKRG
jgi:hypothetical protein